MPTGQFPRKKKPIEQRLFAKVHKTDNCWEWWGSLDSHGYGQIGDENRRLVLVHRASYKIHFGEIPKGMFVCHRCDNPICVRPDHLFLGTNQQNMEDRNRKMRQAHGELAAKAKLFEEDVKEIRARYAAGGTSCAKLGEAYGVTRDSIYAIISRKNWKHVP